MPRIWPFKKRREGSIPYEQFRLLLRLLQDDHGGVPYKDSIPRLLKDARSYTLLFVCDNFM